MAHRSATIEPQEKVFTDTAAFIALLMRRDELHKQATEVMLDLSRKETMLYTTEPVLFELANALSNVESRKQAVALIEELRKLSNVEIVWASWLMDIDKT